MAQPKFFLQPLAAAICVACYSPVVFAETPTPVQSLAPIVMTAHQGNDANGLIVRADPKQPIQPIPATDGADYLQSIVGFSAVNSGAGTNGDVTFRGMFGSRIKILTDGTENLGACPSRMDSPTSYISPESYDQISVIKGPQTVQYANTGSAATVIFERRPEQFDEDQHYRGQLSVLAGSFGRLDHNIEVAAGDEQKYIRLNSNRSVSNSYKDGDGNTVPSDWERWNADVALGWTPDADTWVELTGGKADGEAVYAGRTMDGSKFARESLGLRAEKQNVTDVIKKIEAQVNYNFNDHVMDNYSLRQVGMAEHHMTHEMVEAKSAMNVIRRTLNARMAVTHEWDKLQFITGVDSQNNKHGKGMYSATMPGMNSPVTTDMEFQSIGGFGELSYQLNDQNKLVTGIRVDQVEVDAVQTAQQRQETLPSAFIRLENQHPHHDAKTYIGLGYVERMPDYWELFRTDLNGVEGSTFKYLEPEKTLQLDIGYQHEHGAFSSWASAYAGLINDFILMTYDPTEQVPMMKNAADSRNIDATIAGAEVGIGYQFTDAIQADVSAMYAWGENTTNNTPLPQIAPLEGRVNLRYIQDRYTLGAYWRIVDGQNRISQNQGNIVGYDLKESAGFGTLSLNGTYHLSDGVDLSVGIDNVLDKTYTEHLNKMGNAGIGLAANEQFNNVGRNYWARMSFKF
ncbi:TonB-dependent copper receptor [Acinetobacter indicus]|uniref:TonB-dependent copper receptor n=1 Tax=Acinetobacter indicus TaxID=756892 RepID=UPI0005F7C064|nr:TonB-dependent copper receptor [Acinetobacter indicus]KJV41469.1 TonB-dependent receptor [Acinetobacter indicus]OUY07296.1 TonB-dependent copper receptor [Acinetobacter indicus]